MSDLCQICLFSPSSPSSFALLFRPTDLISVVEAFVVIAVVFTADAAAASDVAAGIPAAAAAAVITWEVYLSRTRRETWSCA